MDVINYLLKLVILALPLFAIPAMLKSSNSMLGKIYGTTQNLGNKLTGGMREDANKRAGLAKTETAARRTTAGVNPDGTEALNYNDRRNRFRRYMGGRATRTEAQRQNREGEAKRLLEDDVMKNMGERPDKYVGEGANRGTATNNADIRVGLQIDKMGLKRQIEGMEPVKLRGEAIKLRQQQIMEELRTMDSGGKVAELQQRAIAAAQSNNYDEMKAVSNVLAAQGAPGINALDQVTQATQGDAAEELAAHLGSEHYQTLEEKAPEILGFVNSAGKDSSTTPDASTWKKVTADTIGKLNSGDKGSLEKALQHRETDQQGNVRTAVSDSTIKDALLPLRRGSLSEEARQKIELEARARGIIK